MADDSEEIIIKEDDGDFSFQGLTGLREALSIAKRQPSQVSYKDALEIVFDLDPVAYDRFVELLTKRNKSDEVRYYLEKAEALSTEQEVVLPIDLIEKDLKEIETALSKKKVRGTSLMKKKITLLGAIEYFKPRKVSEHKILNRDFYLANQKIPNALKIYADETFVDYKLADDRFLRLRLLHPDKDEEILGSDLIYEQFDFEKEKVRFVQIQFKTWGKKGLYFSQGNMQAQINKLCNNLCDSNYCKSNKGENIGDGYRFPFCSGFLRPTDKQLDNDKDMTSTGLHIPICHVKRIASELKKISKVDAKNSGISNTIFNELFVNGFIGSRWMPIDELQTFYSEKGIDNHVNSIRIHAQEILMETESEKAKKKGK